MSFDLSNYENVASRISKFWEAHPEGRIYTELVTLDDKTVVMRADVFRKMDELPWATGFAMESVPREAKPIEVCETSAIGRALANAGYATTVEGSRMSREEAESLNKAKAAPKPKPKAEPTRTSGQQDDVWQTGADPFSGPPKTLEQAVQTIADQMGGEVVTVQEDALRGPARQLSNTRGSSTEKQRGFAASLIKSNVPEAVDADSVTQAARELLDAAGRGPLDDWDELSKAQASYLIELMKGAK